jgi:hypothetical protein
MTPPEGRPMTPNTHLDEIRIAEAARDSAHDRSKFIAHFNPERVLAMLAEIETLKGERDEALGDRDEYRDLLHDLVMLDAEAWAIGGGPGFKERHDKAWGRARERFEP